ncbi:hypothetical protein VRZ08_05480 [Rhodopseudomonas sp. G2_2311]|uniref:hypothetical protein n=1 Tax=Rhodopseudomonas sp. G2_2311 TaxID=3114287 RepID=UPI0039C5FEDC
MTTTVKLRAMGRPGSGKSLMLDLIGELMAQHGVVVSVDGGAECIDPHTLICELPDELASKLEEKSARMSDQEANDAQVIRSLATELEKSKARETDLTARLDRTSLALGMAAEIFARDGTDDLASFFGAAKYRDCSGTSCARPEAETEIPL